MLAPYALSGSFDNNIRLGQLPSNVVSKIRMQTIRQNPVSKEIWFWTIKCSRSNISGVPLIVVAYWISHSLYMFLPIHMASSNNITMFSSSFYLVNPVMWHPTFVCLHIEMGGHVRGYELDSYFLELCFWKLTHSIKFSIETKTNK